jgi:hypothetical protein
MLYVKFYVGDQSLRFGIISLLMEFSPMMMFSIRLCSTVEIYCRVVVV